MDHYLWTNEWSLPTTKTKQFRVVLLQYRIKIHRIRVKVSFTMIERERENDLVSLTFVAYQYVNIKLRFLCEPIWKRCRFSFHFHCNVNEPLHLRFVYIDRNAKIKRPFVLGIIADQ